MKEMQLFTEIIAAKEKVWDTLWEDATFRQWAGIIDPGTYMKGELKEGSEVEFISAENGYGVTSLVEKVVPNEFLLLRHHADTQDAGTAERDKQWTGGAETYELSGSSHTTLLTVTFDVPTELEDYFKDTYPKALEKVKTLAEQNS